MGHGNPLHQHQRARDAHERFAPAERSGYLYYVRLKTDVGRFYKLGFTKRVSVNERLGFGGSKNAELVDKELCFVHLDDAYDVEGRLHLYFRQKKAFGTFSADPDMPLEGSGQGELYREDILQLDDDYSVLRNFFTFYKTFTKKHNPLIFVLGTALSIAIIVPLAMVGWLVHKALGNPKEPYFAPRWSGKRDLLAPEIARIVDRLKVSMEKSGSDSISR